MIPERVSIDRRFLGANNRTRYGHWEKDAVVSRKGCRGSLAVAQERKSRLIVAAKTRTMSPVEHQKTTKAILSDLMVKSVSFDNGIENKNHAHLHLPTFFATHTLHGRKEGLRTQTK